MLTDMPESTSKRWDTDTRGQGVGDARTGVPAIQQLVELANSLNWVTEDPEAHLLPGLQRAGEGSGLTLTTATVESDGALTIQLTASRMLTRREIRQAVWAILGGVAELSTFVRETGAAETVSFDVVTGVAPGDGQFASHGHTLRLRVAMAAS